MALGVGLSSNNTRAVLQALLGRASPFVRTPKYLRTDGSRAFAEHALSERATPSPRHRSIEGVGLELVLAAYLVGCIAMALRPGPTLWAVPFLAIFATGYLWVGLGSLRSVAPRRWSAPALRPTPSTRPASQPRTSPPPLLAVSPAPASPDREHTGR